ncbi:carbohydrate-binding module family 1 protein/Glycoside hydrolase family 5 protein [Mycena alexandri]|uniref:cellulase n=1 Tax=Mycena alexandri TaxID=1745969 RepID=A0AAD6SGQ6_9AGAR|nr:carbohydrate-binding module family 1 protein/Glycoside hydrolase family 5 protein [Mycena alexandri]
MLKTLVPLSLVVLGASSVKAQAAVWAQCGGQGWTGATTCVAGSVCTALNDFYSQCIPGTAPPTSTSPTTGTPTSSATGPSASCASPAPGSGTLKLVGVNIAGFDFGMDTTGTQMASAAYPPLTQYFGKDGKGQMTHFVNDDGYNVFRLPVGWQFLTNNVVGGTINETNLVEYDALVQTCLATGASCIIDIHNYARWNGGIIGQGGPTNAQFAALWSAIATQYKSTPKVIFGVMNEPHDIPDIKLWAGSVQAAVTAIRNAGATTQMILLPGNDWTSAQTFISDGSADALKTVVNPDGSVTNLIFDVHKYLDSDNSGTHAECVTNNIEEAWAPLAQWLRCNGRQAFNTETGGGNTASCITYMCQQIAYQAQNSDVILGYVGWAAGNFDVSYVLSELPAGSGSSWTDTTLVSSCMAPKAGAQKGATS